MAMTQEEMNQEAVIPESNVAPEDKVAAPKKDEEEGEKKERKKRIRETHRISALEDSVSALTNMMSNFMQGMQQNNQAPQTSQNMPNQGAMAPQNQFSSQSASISSPDQLQQIRAQERFNMRLEAYKERLEELRENKENRAIIDDITDSKAYAPRAWSSDTFHYLIENKKDPATLLEAMKAYPDDYEEIAEDPNPQRQIKMILRLEERYNQQKKKSAAPLPPTGVVTGRGDQGLVPQRSKEELARRFAGLE